MPISVCPRYKKVTRKRLLIVKGASVDERKGYRFTFQESTHPHF